MQMEGLEQRGPCGAPVVWQNNARHGGGACLCVQKHINFVMGALKMLLLNLPHVQHPPLVQEGNRKFLAFSPISSLRGCSIMRGVCISTLVHILLCRANSSFVICWSTSCYKMPDKSSHFIYSLLALHRMARSFLSHLKIHHDSLAMKIRYRGCASFVHTDASWSVWSGRCRAC